MMKLRCIFSCITVALAVTACGKGEKPPEPLNLRLAPAALGASISLQQHLRVEREGRTDHLDAVLEIDDEHLGMVGMALGQRVLSLDYDGRELKTWRHPMLPEQVRSESVLEDIQLTYWPVEAIRAALPAGWRIEDEGRHRTLWSGETQVMTVDYSSEPRWGGTVVLSNLRYRYKLTIESVAAGS